MQPALVISLGAFAARALEKIQPHLQTIHGKLPPLLLLGWERSSLFLGDSYSIPITSSSRSNSDLQPYLFESNNSQRIQYRRGFLRHLLTSKQQFATFIQRSAERTLGSQNIPFDVYVFASLGDLAVSGMLYDILNAITWALESDQRKFRVFVHLALPEATDERVTPEISSAAFACLRELEDAQLNYTPLYPIDSALAECNLSHVPFTNLLLFSKSVGNVQNLMAIWAALIISYLDDPFGNVLKQVWNNVPNAVTQAQAKHQSLILSAPLMRMAWFPLGELQHIWAYQLLHETLQRLQSSVQIESEFLDWIGGRGYRGIRDELVYAPELIEQFRNLPTTGNIPNDLVKQLFILLCAYGDPHGQHISQLTAESSIQTMLNWQPDLRNFTTSKGLFESVEQHLDTYFGHEEAANGGSYGLLLKQSVELQTIRFRLALLAWIKHLLNGQVYPFNALAGLERVEAVFQRVSERLKKWEQIQPSFQQKREQLVKVQHSQAGVSITAVSSYITQAKNTLQLGFLRASLRSSLDLCAQILKIISNLKQTLARWRYALPEVSSILPAYPELASNVYPLYDETWAKQIYNQYLKSVGTQLDDALRWKLSLIGQEIEITLTLEEAPLPIQSPREVERMLLNKAEQLTYNATAKLSLWDYLIPNERQHLTLLEHFQHLEDPLPGTYFPDQTQQQYFMLTPISDAPNQAQRKILTQLQGLATDRLIHNGDLIGIKGQTHLIMFCRRDVLPWQLSAAYQDLNASYRQFIDKSTLFVIPRSAIAAQAEAQLERLKVVAAPFRLDPAITVLYKAQDRLGGLVWIEVLNWWGWLPVSSQSFRWQMRPDLEGFSAWWIGQESNHPRLFDAATAFCFGSHFEPVNGSDYGEFRDFRITEAIQAYFDQWYQNCPPDFLNQVPNQQWWGRAKSLARTRQRSWGMISAQKCQLLYDYFYPVFNQTNPDPDPLELILAHLAYQQYEQIFEQLNRGANF